MTAADAAETRDKDSKSRRAANSEGKGSESTSESGTVTSLVDSVFETAHKVALAGVGVAGEAAEAGSKVFDRLVDRGEKIEAQGKESFDVWREKAEERVGQVRTAAEVQVEKTKSKARSGFEQTKARAQAGIDGELERRLERLGVPGKADLEAVLERLSAVEARLEALEKP